MKRNSSHLSRFAKVIMTAVCVGLFTRIDVSIDPFGMPSPMAGAPNTLHPAANADVRDASSPERAVLAHRLGSGGFAMLRDSQIAETMQPMLVEPSPVWRYLRSKIEPSDHGHPETWVEVSGSVVNLRAGPSIKSRRIGNFKRGTRLRVLKRKESWSRVTNAGTEEPGWMHRDYLDEASSPKSASASSVPARQMRSGT